MTARTRDERTEHTEHIDVDTAEKGTTAPFEYWEGDHTALVHVLWAAEHHSLIARRPGTNRPLRRALFDRLFGTDKWPYVDGLVADLRAILDAHDPDATPGAIGAEHLTRDEDEAARLSAGLDRFESDPIDATASALRSSRWFAAATADAVAKALREAAFEEQDALDGSAAAAERLRARARSTDGKA